MSQPPLQLRSGPRLWFVRRGPAFAFMGCVYSAGGGVACASGRLAAAPRKRPEAVSGGRTLCAPTHLFLCGDVPCIPRAAPRPPFIRAPSVWCPFFRRGAQCAPAYLCLRGDVPPGAAPLPPFVRSPSVWCSFFRRGAQRAPAGSRRSHPAGADMIHPMFSCLIPRGNRYHSPARDFFPASGFPAIRRAGLGPAPTERAENRNGGRLIAAPTQPPL